MAHNPYTPPTTEVADAAPSETSPAIWNPNAAANWSLLFTPAFGALIHMKNWRALGEPARAATAKVWVIVSFVFLALVVLLGVVAPDSKPIDAASRGGGLILLIAWYAGSGREQARYVKSRFGNGYVRRGWGRPLMIAFAALVALFVIGIVSALVSEPIA